MYPNILFIFIHVSPPCVSIYLPTLQNVIYSAPTSLSYRRPRAKKVLMLFNAEPLRARRVLTLFNAAPLRARRALSWYTLNSDSALLVLVGTSLHSDNALLALNWRYDLFVTSCKTFIFIVLLKVHRSPKQLKFAFILVLGNFSHSFRFLHYFFFILTK